MLEATPAEVILHNDISDFAPLDQWSVGRITLLGDAAHATTPNMGQGACMAIESADVLAQCLAKQGTKLASSGITHYFKSVVTSARAGHKKPAREIFDLTLAESGFTHQQAVMIGDNIQTDIGGARNANVDTIYFNPDRLIHNEIVTHEIHDLKQLRDSLNQHNHINLYSLLA